MNWQQRFEKMPEAIEEVKRRKEEDKATEHLFPKREPTTPEMSEEELAAAMKLLRRK